MLVLISDLHFTDGSAGEHNILTKTFEEIFGEIRLNAEAVNAEDIKLVFLGDVFDILRTEKWFEVPMNHRPWGVISASDYQAMETHANKIMDEVLTHHENAGTFKLLSGSLKDQFGFEVEPERIYILGNHDRIYGQLSSLFDKGVKALASSSTTPLYSYHDRAHGIFARHGHEFDPFNYEGSKSYTDKDYQQMPIGEVITTELIAKIPYKVMRHPKVQSLSPEDQASLRRNLHEIESVRPLSATISWLFYQVKKDEWLEDIIDDCIKEVLDEFVEIDFVKLWMRKHLKPFRWSKSAIILKMAFFALRILSLQQIEFILKIGAKFNIHYKDPTEKGAITEFEHQDSDTYYVAYGHTHSPVQVPIKAVFSSNTAEKDHVYINTGTWVDKYEGAREGGFINWNRITYSIFYNRQEAKCSISPKLDCPVFEVWTGALKKRRTI